MQFRGLGKDRGDPGSPGVAQAGVTFSIRRFSHPASRRATPPSPHLPHPSHRDTASKQAADGGDKGWHCEQAFPTPLFLACPPSTPLAPHAMSTHTYTHAVTTRYEVTTESPILKRASHLPPSLSSSQRRVLWSLQVRGLPSLRQVGSCMPPMPCAPACNRRHEEGTCRG